MDQPDASSDEDSGVSEGGEFEVSSSWSYRPVARMTERQLTKLLAAAQIICFLCHLARFVYAFVWIIRLGHAPFLGGSPGALGGLVLILSISIFDVSGAFSLFLCSVLPYYTSTKKCQDFWDDLMSYHSKSSRYSGADAKAD